MKCMQKKIVSSIYVNAGKHDDKKTDVGLLFCIR